MPPDDHAVLGYITSLSAGSQPRILASNLLIAVAYHSTEITAFVNTDLASSSPWSHFPIRAEIREKPARSVSKISTYSLVRHTISPLIAPLITAVAQPLSLVQ